MVLQPEFVDESQVMRRCQSGDLRGFKLIYNHYHQSFLRIALRMLGNLEDAEDAVQMTFVKFYRSIKKFEHRSKLSTYLFRILINVCFQFIEKRKKMQFLPIENKYGSDPPDHELRIQLERAITTLPPKMRICFILFAIEEFRQSEIAKILDLSLGGVKSNIFHAKVRLRSLLSEYQIRRDR